MHKWGADVFTNASSSSAPQNQRAERTHAKEPAHGRERLATRARTPPCGADRRRTNLRRAAPPAHPGAGRAREGNPRARAGAPRSNKRGARILKAARAEGGRGEERQGAVSAITFGVLNRFSRLGSGQDPAVK